MTPTGKNKLPHQLEMFDFVTLYHNIPVSCLKRVMKELLQLVFTYEQVIYGYKSIYVKFGYKNDEATPDVNEVHWLKHPVGKSVTSGDEVPPKVNEVHWPEHHVGNSVTSGERCIVVMIPWSGETGREVE